MKSDSATELRQKILSQQNALTPEDRRRLSHKATDRWVQVLGLKEKGFNPLRIGMYRALPNELLLDELEGVLKKASCTLYYPRVIRENGRPSQRLEFVKYPESAQAEFWVKGTYGIQEPRLEFASVNPQELELILVPGLVFGKSGERIGRGAGYYDRFLPQATRALRVALVFDFQILETIPQGSHDQKMHWVVSDSRQFCISNGPSL